jgi:hypothetical protein
LNRLRAWRNGRLIEILKPQNVDFLQKLSAERVVASGVEKVVRGMMKAGSGGLSFPELENQGGVVLRAGQIELAPQPALCALLLEQLQALSISATLEDVSQYLTVRLKHPPPPIPYRPVQETIAVIQKMFAPIEPFNPRGQSQNLPMIWLNCEYLNADKCADLGAVYAFIFSCGALVGLAEANSEGIEPIAQTCGYNYAATAANTRGQACCMLWHPDIWNCIAQAEHEQVAQIIGVPELRPTLELILQHRQTGTTMRFLSSHFKSLSGGWEATAAIRFEQTTKLLNIIEAEPPMPTIALGDYNCPLNLLRLRGTKDVDPFVTAGWSLLGGNTDQTSTHAKEGRIDGIFSKWLGSGVELSDYRVVPIFAEAPEVSDHAAVIGKLGVPLLRPALIS